MSAYDGLLFAITTIFDGISAFGLEGQYPLKSQTNQADYRNPPSVPIFIFLINDIAKLI